MVTENVNDFGTLRQGGVVALAIGALFWLGYTYATVIDNGNQLQVVINRQINVRERMGVLEYKLDYLIKNQEALHRSYPYVDKSDEAGGRGK